MNLSIPAKEIWKYIEDDSTIEVSKEPTKHDCYVTDYVTKIDGKYYQFLVEYSRRDGILLDNDFDLEEVEPRETVVTTWHKVKTNKTLRDEPPAPQKCVKAWPVFDTVGGEYPRN